MNKLKEIKTLWGWLDEIMIHKSPLNEILVDSWDSFSIFMIHRFLSMNSNNVQVVNFVQQQSTLEKEQVYLIYKQIIPKGKVWSKYIKSKTSNYDAELIKKISKYFTCSLKESSEYLNILNKDAVVNILKGMGEDEKEIKKLIKKL